MKRSHWRSACGVALLGLVLASGTGCLGRSPAPRLYTLAAVNGASANTAARELALLVGPVRVPQYLDRPQIVTREGANEVVPDEYRRWAGGLEANVLRVLAANLTERLQTRRVVEAPRPAPFPIDYQVLVDFDELVADASGQLALRARWVIRDGNGETRAIGSSSLTQPVAGRSAAEGIHAHELALGGLADALATSLAELSAREPVEAAPD